MLDSLTAKLGRRLALEALVALNRRGQIVHSGGHFWTADQYRRLPADMRPSAEPFAPLLPTGKRQCDLYDMLAALGAADLAALCAALADSASAAEGLAAKNLQDAYRRAASQMIDRGLLDIDAGVVSLPPLR